MCRLCAITATNLKNRKFIFNELMSLSRQDDNQRDGFGVWSTGGLYHKNRLSYDKSDLQFFKNLSPKDMVMGHVRKASVNTEISDNASHPYLFVNEDKSTSFIGAHNGCIYGLPEIVNVKTDSANAFAHLYNLVHDAPITKDILETWMSTFHDNSSFAFLISQGNKLFAVRGARTLAIARIGNGWILNTNADTLEKISYFVKGLCNATLGEIFEIAENTLVTLEPEKDIVVESLNYTMIPAPISYRTYSNEYDVQAWSHWGKREKKEDEKTKKWKKIRELTNPLRIDILCHFYSIATGQSEFSTPLSTTDSGLDVFIRYIETYMRLESGDRKMIDRWNVIIPRADERRIQREVFGKGPFFHYPDDVMELFFDAVQRTNDMDFLHSLVHQGV